MSLHHSTAAELGRGLAARQYSSVEVTRHFLRPNGRQNAVEVFYGSGVGRFSPGQTVLLDEGMDRYSHIVGDLNAE